MATDPIQATQFGKVVGRFIYVVGDTSTDPDALPDITPATGTITFTPDSARLIVPGSPIATTAVPRPVTVGLDAQGYIIDATGTQGVWLLEGSYTVSFALTGGVTLPAFQIVLDADIHTATTPLDLTLWVPIAPTPTVQFVVNEQVYLDTLAARDEAQATLAAVDAFYEAEGPVRTGLTWTGTVSLATLADVPRTLHATLVGNTTLTLPTPTFPRAFTVTLVVTQDATGGRTLTVTNARTPMGLLPPLSTTGGSVDLLHLYWNGSFWLLLTGAQSLAVPTGWSA